MALGSWIIFNLPLLGVWLIIGLSDASEQLVSPETMNLAKSLGLEPNPAVIAPDGTAVEPPDLTGDTEENTENDAVNEATLDRVAVEALYDFAVPAMRGTDSEVLRVVAEVNFSGFQKLVTEQRSDHVDFEDPISNRSLENKENSERESKNLRGSTSNSQSPDRNLAYKYTQEYWGPKYKWEERGWRGVNAPEFIPGIWNKKKDLMDELWRRAVQYAWRDYNGGRGDAAWVDKQFWKVYMLDYKRYFEELAVRALYFPKEGDPNALLKANHMYEGYMLHPGAFFQGSRMVYNQPILYPRPKYVPA